MKTVLEANMSQQPKFSDPYHQGSNKLAGKVVIITGGDSRIGRAVAISFALEGANIVIVYSSEHKDAEYTKKNVESIGRCCILIASDLREVTNCKKVVNFAIQHFKKIDILL